VKTKRRITSKNVSFVKGVPDFENPVNVPTLIVLDDLIDSAYSTKVSELFTKGSHHRNITLVLITQTYFTKVHRHVIFL